MNPRCFLLPDRWTAGHRDRARRDRVGAAKRDAGARSGTAPRRWSSACISAAGLPFLVWGLVVLDPWITAFGLAVQMAGKLWFLDRMALLYDDVSSAAGPVRPQTDR